MVGTLRALKKTFALTFMYMSQPHIQKDHINVFCFLDKLFFLTCKQETLIISMCVDNSTNQKLFKTNQMLLVRCLVSGVRCHMSTVACHLCLTATSTATNPPFLLLHHCVQQNAAWYFLQIQYKANFHTKICKNHCYQFGYQVESSA